MKESSLSVTVRWKSEKAAQERQRFGGARNDK